MQEWLEVKDIDKLITPVLLIFPDRIELNITEMIKIAGTADRLRPHVKTHKSSKITKLQIDKGITKFKCATLAEAKMLGHCGATDVLVAYPQIGPALQKFLELTETFPDTRFSMLIDQKDALLTDHSSKNLDIFIDLNVGMNRTGCSVNEAAQLKNHVDQSGHHFRGWHAYDGHIHDSDPEIRAQVVEKTISPVLELIKETNTEPDELVCGGSITFPIHAAHSERRLSPGTTLLWDHGYASQFPDLPFQISAVVLSRVVSKPSPGQLCIDLGHKAIASEMTAAPANFPQLQEAKVEMHSEEHMVLSTENADDFHIGQAIYAFPYHICPTVGLHHEMAVIKNGQHKEFWPISARNRIYTQE